MKKIIALATVAAFSTLATTGAFAQTTGPSGQDTTTKGTDTMSKDGMKGGGKMAPTGGPTTNDASKSGAASAMSAEKGMTSKGTITQAK